MTTPSYDCDHTYPDVTVGGREYEHYDRLGPGCWHPKDQRGPCLSWQGLIHEAETTAVARYRTRVDKLERELADAQAAVEKLRSDRDYWKAVYQEISSFYWGRPVA